MKLLNFFRNLFKKKKKGEAVEYTPTFKERLAEAARRKTYINYDVTFRVEVLGAAFPAYVTVSAHSRIEAYKKAKKYLIESMVITPKDAKKAKKK